MGLSYGRRSIRTWIQMHNARVRRQTDRFTTTETALCVCMIASRGKNRSTFDEVIPKINVTHFFRLMVGLYIASPAGKYADLKKQERKPESKQKPQLAIHYPGGLALSASVCLTCKNSFTVNRLWLRKVNARNRNSY